MRNKNIRLCILPSWGVVASATASSCSSLCVVEFASSGSSSEEVAQSADRTGLSSEKYK